MTGKELVLVLAGAAATAGAGGMAAATLMNDGPPAGADQTALLEKLDRLGESMDGTNAILQESRDEIGRLRGRLEAVEAGMHGVRAAPRTTESGRRRVDVSRHGSATIEEVGDGSAVDYSTDLEIAADEIRAGMQEALQDLKVKLETGGGSPQLGTLFSDDGRIAGLSGALEGLQRSFELRRLPESERWEKAREEVGLNDVQIDEIKAAIAERDEAIDGSMVIERDEEDGNGRISVRRMDFEKAREANAAYENRVDNVLNDQQKKAWKENGYANAFGRGAMGTATVISVGTITNHPDEAE